MTTSLATYYLIGRCPSCQRIVVWLPVTPDMGEHQQAMIRADWQKDGWRPDTVTRFLLNNSPRGCICPAKGESK